MTRFMLSSVPPEFKRHAEQVYARVQDNDLQPGGEGWLLFDTIDMRGAALTTSAAEPGR